MADAVLRAAALRKHIQSLARDLLTLIPGKNVCGLHRQRKFSTFLSRMEHHSLHQTLLSRTLNKLCVSVYARYITSHLHYCLSAQVVASCSINSELSRRNSGVNLGGTNITSSQYVQVRQKSKNRQHSDGNASDDSDEDDALDEDDFEAPPNFKVLKMNVASTRADAVVSNALDVARNNLEDIFLGSGLYLNGSKLLKKSTKIDVGDYVDMVVEKTDNQLKVKRVKLLKIYPEKTSKDKLIMKLRVWKTPFLMAKPEYEPKDS